MPKARNKILLGKSIDACLAAIEIYNKPDFKYREETFSILMLNAWELLLKARILKENKNKLRSIEVWEQRPTLGGGMTRRRYPKLNRSKSATTISVANAVETVRQFVTSPLDPICVANIYLLLEIRDHAVHFVNLTSGLSRKIQEVGSASLRNYMHCVEGWFKEDLSRFNFYLMPLAFHHPLDEVKNARPPRPGTPLRKLAEHLEDAEKQHPSDVTRDFNVALRIEMRFTKTSSPDALQVRVTADSKAPAVRLSEEDVREKWPWDFGRLCTELRKRYSDFVYNNKFHGLRKPLETDQRYCHPRYLDPANLRSSKKLFYSPNILPCFDTHYTRRS